MLNKVGTLKGHKIAALDGDVGKVKDLYFDDHHWTVRYLLADTGSWLSGRLVLLSPYALVGVNEEEKEVAVNLTKKQIENSPPMDSDKPVSRQFEESYYGYYGWPMYWGGPYAWGPYPYVERDPGKWAPISEQTKAWDPHLRSTREVTGYHLQGLDGEVGHVSDFIIDDETWAIRYLIVNTLNWWPGKKVLISPHWIERVSWLESKVFVNLDRETIKRSPEYVEEFLVTREYETDLHHHYHREGYWVDELMTH